MNSAEELQVIFDITQETIGVVRVDPLPYDLRVLQHLKTIVPRGFDINHTDKNDYCALAYAAEYNFIESVKYLLSFDHIKTNLQVNESEDDLGGIPLHMAAFRGHLEIIRLLVAKSPDDIDVPEYCGYTPLHETVLSGHYGAFKLLLRLGADDGAETGRDVSAIDVPKGMNTLQLIAHRASEDPNNRVFCDMWAFLVRQKLRKNESIIGNALPDEDDSDDDFADPMAYESTSALIERSGRDDFKEAYEREKKRKKGIEDHGEVFTDSDSESDAGYDTDDIKDASPALALEQHFAVDAPDKQLVLHARGNHFYKNHETLASRRKYVRYSSANVLTAWGMYSADAHARAEVSLALPDHNNTTRDIQLEQASQQTNAVLAGFHAQKEVAPILQRDSAESMARKSFESRLIELVQRYVNSYTALTEDIANAQNKTERDFRNDRTKAKQRTLVQLRKNPFVSTSEDIGVGLEYAFALLNYDKKETHRPVPTLDFTLTPEYQLDGDVKHPYLGVIFITLHTEHALQGHSLNIAELFRDNKIDPMKGPGTHETSGYVRALEHVFFGGISSDHVCLAKVVRVPNLYHPYRSFVMTKYGLTANEYIKYKKDLAESGKIDPINKKMKNEKDFYRTQEQLIQHVIRFERTKLIRAIQAWAREKGVTVGSLDDRGQFVANIDIDIPAKIG